jgi:hypothetical protein
MIFQVADRTPEVFDAELLADEADLDAYEGKALTPELRYAILTGTLTDAEAKRLGLPVLNALGRLGEWDPDDHPRAADGTFTESFTDFMRRLGDLRPPTAEPGVSPYGPGNLPHHVEAEAEMIERAYLDANGGEDDFGETVGRFTGELKAHVATTLTDRLADIPTADLVDAATQFPGWKFVDLRDAETRPFRVKNGVVHTFEDTPEWFAERRIDRDAHVADAYFPGTPEHERHRRETAVSFLVQTWASTSNDNSPMSLALQHATDVEFELDDVSTWDTDKVKPHGSYDEQPHVYRAFARAMYDETQAWLAKNGITEVTAYRGHSLDADQIPVPGNIADIKMRPMSSWTTRESVAERFASEYAKKDSGVVFAARIPAERILALPLTGIGCYDEHELVILGGRMNAAIVWYDGILTPDELAGL